MIKVSVCLTAYNEEKNIRRLLEAVLSQRTKTCEITEIIVVASGCNDNTENIVNEFVKKEPRIKLISQKEREGKASAINEFLKVAEGDVCVLESADTVPGEDTIESLVISFNDDRVGMTGAHPVPVDSKETFLGFTTNLLWELHHKLALKHPKLGEMVAFRNIVKEIPVKTAVDEVSIEAKIMEAGLSLKYCPDAVVYNKGSESVSDFLKQRRRIFNGHLWVRKYSSYVASSMNPFRIFILLLSELKPNLKSIIFTFGAVFLEAYGRFLGYIDFYLSKKNPYKWDISSTTKKVR